MTTRAHLSPLIVATLALAASGCERVVDLDLEPGPVRLVIEGGVRRPIGGTDSTQTIRLTTTDQLTSDRPPPPVRDALVEVSDEMGRVWDFTESDPGTYQAAFWPVVGARYRLRIEVDGERYEGTDVLTAVPPIDSLYFEFEESNIAVGDEGFRAAIDYTDPPGVENYYLWEQLIDGESSLTPDPGNRFRVIGDDNFIDGATITGYQPYDEAVVEPGQTVVVRQVALSERSFRYLFALFEQSGDGQGSIFSVPPASVRGNVANLTNPEHYPLGYFLAAQVAQATATLEP